MKYSNKFRLGSTAVVSRIALAIAASAIGSAPALGQETASGQAHDDQSQGLEDIVVTARRVEENLQKVPVAVTAFSGEALQTRNIQAVRDLASFTPSLQMRESGASPSSNIITIRGLVQTDVLATLDPSVGTYVDGFYWARAYGTNGNFLDAKSAQILKGPQGTLFGRNTTGGAVVITSNDPDLADFSGRLSLTYGRFDEFEATGIINVPVVPGKVALRLAGSRLSRDGYSTTSAPASASTAFTPAPNVFTDRPPFVGSPNGRKMDNRDRWNGRAKLLLVPTENLSLLFSTEYFDLDERVPANIMRLATNGYTASNPTYNTSSSASLYAGILSGGPLPTSPANAAASIALGRSILNGQIAQNRANPGIILNNEADYSRARTWTHNFTGTLDTDWGAIKLMVGYRKVSSATLLDLDGSTFAIHGTEARQSLSQRSAEIQITGRTFADRLSFAAGAFAFGEKGSDQTITIALPLLNPSTNNFWGDVKSTSIGVYGQGTYELTEQLSITAGLRYSADNKGLDSRNNNYNRTNGTVLCSVNGVSFTATSLVTNPIQCSQYKENFFSGLSYTLGAEYQPTEDILLYIKTSKGFRSGGQNLRSSTSGAFQPFEPEIAYSHEVGFKGEFFDRRLRVNLAAYYTDVNNIQRSALVATPPIPPSTVPGSTTILGNAGKARFKGIEAEIQAVLFTGFRLSASGALTDPSYVRFADLSGDRSFERINGVAKRQFSIAADYDTSLTESVGLKLHVDYAWRSLVPTGEYNWTPNPQNDAIIAATTAPALGLLGARASVSIGDDYELSVFGRNITNERKFVANLLVAPIGYVFGTRREPATYGVSATVKF